MSRSTAVHFGAGNIGRGFIGPLLSKTHHVVFADIQEEIIQAINSEHSYDIHIVSADKPETQTINNVEAASSKDSSQLNKHILNADIITTSVGPEVLERIAPAVADGIKARANAKKGTLNVIACENLQGATTLLREHVEKALKDDSTVLKYMNEHVGFANCTVDRIVPPFESEKVLDVAVEDFYEWIVDHKGLKEPIPKIDGMSLTDSLEGYVERKLFTLNTGHAALAYIGHLKGHDTIDQSLKDPEIRPMVEAAMKESGDGLVKKHDFDPNEHEEYVQKILDRFENPELNDDLSRLARAPLRKLQQNDRLVGPINIARDYDLPRDNLIVAVAAALLFDDPEDEDSVQMHKVIKEKGIAGAIEEFTGIKENSEDSKAILKRYKQLREMAERKSRRKLKN